MSNAECYNLSIDTTKLCANEDPNATILGLVQLVESFGDVYTDDLPITKDPPFEYIEDMTEIQKTMLAAYIKDKTVKVMVFSIKAISAKMPIISENTAPQIAPSNIPTATATAGSTRGHTPNILSFVNSIFCATRERNI